MMTGRGGRTSYPGPILAALLLPAIIEGCGCGGASMPAVSGGTGPTLRHDSTGSSAPHQASEEGFQKIAEISDKCGARLWSVENALLASDEGCGRLFAVIEGDTVVRQPGITRGLPMEADEMDHGRIARVFGSWPDNLWLVWRYQGAWDEWYDRVFRLRDGTWVEVTRTELDYHYLDVWLQKDCVIGVESNGGHEGEGGIGAQTEIHCNNASKPELVFRYADPKPADFNLANARGFPTGDVLVLDYENMIHVGPKHRPRLWSFGPRSGKPTSVPIPFPEGVQSGEPLRLTGTRFIGRSPTDVYVMGNLSLESESKKGRHGSEGRWVPPLLVHYDGSSVSRVPSPPLLALDEGAVSTDGTLMLIGAANGDDLTERVVVAFRDGGPWKPMPLPPDRAGRGLYTPRGIVAHGRNEVWVVAEGKGDRYALFRSR